MMNPHTFVLDTPVDSAELIRIQDWLAQREYCSVGASAFLKLSLSPVSGWQLLRQYDSILPQLLISVAVLHTAGTCFWVLEENKQAAEIIPLLLKFQPSRMMTTAYGRDLLQHHLQSPYRFIKQHDQWIMQCHQSFPQHRAEIATAGDLQQLIEYQRLYNLEREVNEVPNWMTLIEQQKVIVCREHKQIVAVLKLGIETDTLVTIGGTYTFTSHRRKGYAVELLGFAVDRIVRRGRIAHLIVDMENVAAIQLYEKMGFVCVGEAYVGYLDDGKEFDQA